VKVLVSGSTGLLGSAFVAAAQKDGNDVVRLVRPKTLRRNEANSSNGPGSGTVQDLPWDPTREALDSAADGAAAVVHLAGASIAGSRWTDAHKKLLRESRVDATDHLVGALAKLRRPPPVFVAASAVGFFGDRGDEELTEASPPGSDFLAGLTRDWEAASQRAASFGARVVLLRFGIILARHGGALPRMALPFRLGVGGRVGSGKQWMSWLALDDAVGLMRLAIATEGLSGPVNAVAPQPVRNSEFTVALARALHRPALFPAPAFALRLLLGELADALLLSSQRVLPAKLATSAYRYALPEFGPALESVLH
jgi:uncharacterized protein (TIGR01777 family)